MPCNWVRAARYPSEVPCNKVEVIPLQDEQANEHGSHVCKMWRVGTAGRARTDGSALMHIRDIFETHRHSSNEVKKRLCTCPAGLAC